MTAAERDDDLALLRDTARRIAAAHPVTSADADAGSVAAVAWPAVTASGLDGLRQAADGGRPLADVGQAAVVVEELARTLCAAPVLGSAVLGHELLRLAGADAAIVADLAGARNVVAVALDPALEHIARSDEAVAFDAALATTAVCLRGDEVVAVPIGPALPGVDGSRALRPVTGQARGLGLHVDDDAIRRWQTVALTAVAADALGAMAAIFDAAVGYAKTRQQFGRPIGAFQAVQHLCADGYVRIEAIRSAILLAAWSAVNEPARDALTVATVAKAYAAVAGPRVVQIAIQVFGGIGATWAHPAHRHLRRVLVDRTVLGDETTLKRRILALRRAS